MKKQVTALLVMASIALPAHAAEQKPYVLSAQERMVEIPVMARGIDRGSMIQPQDIEWAQVAEHKLRRGTVTEEEDIIGKLARRPMRAGEQVSQASLRRPRVIEKGGLIAITYRTGTMNIKDMGIAMEDGSAGDVIRVKNEKSGKVVLAKLLKNGDAVVNYEG